MPAGDPPQVAETSGTSRTTMSSGLARRRTPASVPRSSCTVTPMAGRWFSDCRSSLVPLPFRNEGRAIVRRHAPRLYGSLSRFGSRSLCRRPCPPSGLSDSGIVHRRADRSPGGVLVGEPHLAFRGLPDVREDHGDLLLVQRLLDQQLTDQLVEDVTVLVEVRPRLGVRGLDELQHLLSMISAVRSEYLRGCRPSITVV